MIVKVIQNSSKKVFAAYIRTFEVSTERICFVQKDPSTLEDQIPLEIDDVVEVLSEVGRSIFFCKITGTEKDKYLGISI